MSHENETPDCYVTFLDDATPVMMGVMFECDIDPAEPVHSLREAEDLIEEWCHDYPFDIDAAMEEAADIFARREVAPAAMADYGRKVGETVR